MLVPQQRGVRRGPHPSAQVEDGTAEGFSSTEIGGRLGLSHKTVDTCRQRMMDKLGLHRRSELVHLALENGLLAPAAA